jgi:general secretion pathway protein K
MWLRWTLTQHLAIRQLEYQRDQRQAEWLHIAATDFARFVLAEDLRSGGNDHLGEAWAIPLADTKIADFLRGIDIPQEIRHVSLVGQVSDAQGQFNLNSLVDSTGQINAQMLSVFQRLLENTGADRALASQIANDLNRSGFRFTDPGQLAGFEGVNETVLRKLRPWLTALPESTTINANTASAELLRAAFQGMSASQAAAFVAARAETPLKSHVDIRNLLTRIGVSQSGETLLVDIKTNYFIARSEVQFGESVYVGQSVINRSTTGSTTSAGPGLTHIVSTRFFSTPKE